MIIHTLKSVWFIKCFFPFFTACYFISLIFGCERSQDADAVYVEGIRLESRYPAGQPALAPRPDFGKYEGEGGLNTDTYLCGFKWNNQLLDVDGADYRAGGIIYQVQVNRTSNPFGGTNIWQQQAPIGQTYGWVNLQPEEYDRDEDEEIVKGEYDDNGFSRIAVMLGGPRQAAWDVNVPTDVRWEWPNLGGMIVDTLVELTLTVPKRGGNSVSADFWAYFYRAQFQGFWEPGGGIYAYSSQGVGSPPYSSELKEILLKDMKSKMPATVAEAFFDDSIDEVTAKLGPKDRRVNYPAATSIPKSKTTLMKYDTLTGSVNQIDFQQLRWEYIEPNGWGWYYFDVQPGAKLYTVWCDPNDPNRILGLLRWSEPYCWRALVTPPESFKGETGKFTTYLRAVDDSGGYDPAKTIPITAYITGVYENQLELRSEWWLPSAEPNLHGLYYDEWGNPTIMLYMPQGTHPVLVIPEYGDFNNDKKIDINDIALFVSHWLGYNGCVLDSDRSGIVDYPDFDSFVSFWLSENCNEPNSDCQVYDFDDNGLINFFDYASFSNYWIDPIECGPTYEFNYDGLYDDPNNMDGSIDFSDFASFSKNWRF